jgi:alkanesulfonate monooxygenase SsuD/methylene tetrahydromethanopterin reductase-like flavin-dependent oxidoreductase (luciferase family)
VIDPRQPILEGTAFALRDPLAWPAFSRLIRHGEALGYAAVFLPEIVGRDSLVALGMLAGETERLLLGSGVIPMTSRTTMLTAMAAAAVQERAGGRLLLGLGTGPAAAGALERLRERVAALRALLAGERVETDGRTVQLSLVPDRPVPIWIAALGPRAMRMAGEIADGVLLNWCTPERVRSARTELAAGANAAGRDVSDIVVAAYVRASLGEDAAASMSAMKAAAGEYASYPAYARQFALMGLEDEAAGAAAAHRSGSIDDVPEALVRATCLVGGRNDARGRLDAYREAGADLPVVYPVVAGEDGEASVSRTLSVVDPIAIIS